MRAVQVLVYTGEQGAHFTFSVLQEGVSVHAELPGLRGWLSG